jgi:hypothetical protein
VTRHRSTHNAPVQADDVVAGRFVIERLAGELADMSVRCEVVVVGGAAVVLRRPSMDLRDLVHALLSFDALVARQWVADSLRQGIVWASIPEPADLDPVGLGVAAGVAELLAGRAGQAPPPWASAVEAVPTQVCLVKAARTMPRLRQLCEQEGPEPLRRRGILAPPEFLKVA